MPIESRDAVLSFMEYARTHNVDLASAASTNQALAYYSDELQRAGNPFGPRTSKGKIYDAGPWTWYGGDIISDVVAGGSPLMKWLPTRGVTYRKETVSHLTWVAPDGWDGSDYGAYLDSLTLGECDYGPSPKWESCQYTVQFGKMSTQSDTMNLVEDFGRQLDYERSPIVRLRGPGAGMSTKNDAEFAAAQAAMFMEQHLNWNLAKGVLGHTMQSDGISEVIKSGYVTAHKVGDGACDYSDPIVIDGSMLMTNKDVLTLIRNIVRHILQRTTARGMNIAQNDMAIVMPLAMWAVLADEIPVGAMYPAPSGLLTGGNTPQTAEQYRANLMSGGLGYGFLPVDGRNIPILPGDEFGANVDRNTQITSDIFILTRRAGGLVLLEQQYLDYNALLSGVDVPNRNFSLSQGGIMRYGWLEYNQACYRYFMETYNRVISYFQPVQARLTSVTVNAPSPFIIESYTYTDAFYPQEGTPGTLGLGV